MHRAHVSLFSFFTYSYRIQILHGDGYDKKQSPSQFWKILCRDVGTEIDDILTSSASSSSIEMTSSNDIEILRTKLAEAQDDLLRDEDIFAEKLSEIKRHKKQLKDYEVEISTLKSEIEMMKSASQLRQGEDASDENTSMASISSPGRQKLLPKSPSRGTTLQIAMDSQEDLELSHMIDLHEPDMSQLIEDLETVNQEKEVYIHTHTHTHIYI